MTRRDRGPHATNIQILGYAQWGRENIADKKHPKARNCWPNLYRYPILPEKARKRRLERASGKWSCTTNLRLFHCRSRCHYTTNPLTSYQQLDGVRLFGLVIYPTMRTSPSTLPSRASFSTHRGKSQYLNIINSSIPVDRGSRLS